MKAKPVVPQVQANRDVDEAVAFHLNEDADQAALGLIDALKQACAHIGRHLATLSWDKKSPAGETPAGLLGGPASVALDLIRVADLDLDHGLLGLGEGLLVIVRDGYTGGNATNNQSDSGDCT